MFGPTRATSGAKIASRTKMATTADADHRQPVPPEAAQCLPCRRQHDRVLPRRERVLPGERRCAGVGFGQLLSIRLCILVVAGSP